MYWFVNANLSAAQGYATVELMWSHPPNPAGGYQGPYFIRVVKQGAGIVWESPATSQIDGWVLRPESDNAIAADIDGDGHDEIVMWNDVDEGWIGILKWSDQQGKISVLWAKGSPFSGWHTRRGDYLVAVDGEGHKEILLVANASRWTGLMKWQNNALELTWSSQSPLDGWNRNAGGVRDLVVGCSVIPGNSQQAVFVNTHSNWIGVFGWKGDRVGPIWAQPFPVHGPAGDFTPEVVGMELRCTPGGVRFLDFDTGLTVVLLWQNGQLETMEKIQTK